MLENKNILITGATGFIGYNLAKYLARTNVVYCIVRKLSNLDKLSNIPNIQFIYFDSDISKFTNSLSAVNFDLVYHLASLFIAEHKPENISDLIDSNIKFPNQLLEALSITQAKIRLINTGTAWQNYDNSLYNPTCLYAATKQACEDIIKFYHEAKELSCITLRLYDTYGQNDERKKLFWLLEQLRDSGKDLDMSAGEQKLNIVYIDDVISAFEIAGEMLLFDDRVNAVFGVYSEEEYSLRRIVRLFEEVNNCCLNIHWGKKEYRQRELMQSKYLYPCLPNWSAKIKLNDGLKRLSR